MENVIIFDYDKKKQKYYVIKDFYDSSIKEYMLINDIQGVLISKYHGFDLSNIEFLKDLDFIQDLRFINIVPKKNDVLNSLNNLRRLICAGEFNTEVNFENFPDLEDCSLYWSSKNLNFSTLKKLKTLWISKMNLKNQVQFTFEELDTLTIVDSPIVDIQKIVLLENLKNLELIHLKRITNIEGVGNLINLEKIIISNCRKLENYWDEILKLKKIKWIGLSKLRDIISLGDMKNFNHLKHLAIIEGIKILDGETAELLNLPNLESVSLQNFGFYNMKSWEIQRSLVNKIRPFPT